MLDIRNVLTTYLNTLNISGISLVKDMGSTEEALFQDSEKAVYNDGAILIGDSYFDTEKFVLHNSKLTNHIQLILTAKSANSKALLQTNVLTLVQYLNSTTLNNSQILNCEVISSEPKVKQKISFDYIILNVDITHWESYPPGCPPILAFTNFIRTDSGTDVMHSFVGTWIGAPISTVTYVCDYYDVSTFPNTFISISGSCTHDATYFYLTPPTFTYNDSIWTYTVTMTDTSSRQSSVVFSIS